MKKIIAIMAAALMVVNTTMAQWTHVGGNNDPLRANNVILSIATDRQGNLYAAGEFEVNDSTPIYYVAKWSGDTAWMPLGSGTHALNANGYIYSLATDAAGNVYAAGAFTDQPHVFNGDVYVAKWSDTSWTELGAHGVSPVPASGSAIFSIALDGSGHICAAGDFTDANGKYYVARWNDSAWVELGTGANALNANALIHKIATDAAGNVYAAGDFTDGSGYEYVAKWNGTTWSEMGTGANAMDASSPLTALTTDLSGHVYAAYDDTLANYFVVQWTDSSWQQVGSGTNGLNANNSINVLTTDAAGHLYAAGNFTDGNGYQYVAEWDGTTWTELGTGSDAMDPNAYILAVATDTAFNVYATGYFTDGNSAYYVAEYDLNTQGPNGVKEIENLSLSDLQVVPDPVSGKASVSINVSLEGQYNVSLYDMTGREVSGLFKGSMTTGHNTITFDAAGLSPGIYIVKASDTKACLQTRFIKM